MRDARNTRRCRAVTALAGKFGPLAVLFLAACGSATTESHEASAMRPSEKPPASLARVSALGSPIEALSARDATSLSRVREAGGTVRLIRKSGDRAFYRVGSGCFGIGDAVPAPNRLGQIMCSPEFPTAERPILDFTQYRTPVVNGKPGRRFIARSEGFAADGVAKIAFRDANRRIIAETAVIENAYRFDTLPFDLPADLVALNPAGDVVYVQPVFAGPPGVGPS
jgi:hypothetical protein